MANRYPVMSEEVKRLKDRKQVKFEVFANHGDESLSGDPLSYDVHVNGSHEPIKVIEACFAESPTDWGKLHNREMIALRVCVLKAIEEIE